MDNMDLSAGEQRVMQAVATLEDDRDEPTAHAVADRLDLEVGAVRRVLSDLLAKDLIVELGADDDVGPRYAVKP